MKRNDTKARREVGAIQDDEGISTKVITHGRKFIFRGKTSVNCPECHNELVPPTDIHWRNPSEGYTFYFVNLKCPCCGCSFEAGRLVKEK